VAIARLDSRVQAPQDLPRPARLFAMTHSLIGPCGETASRVAAPPATSISFCPGPRLVRKSRLSYSLCHVVPHLLSILRKAVPEQFACSELVPLVVDDTSDG